jgi:hypothetical protein
MYGVSRAAHPIKFYQEWLFAAPHLRSQTREQRRGIIEGGVFRQLFAVSVRSVIGVLLLFLIVFAPPYSPMYAVVLVVVLSLFLTDFRPWRTYQLALRVFAHHLTYGENSSGAPGVWIPEASARFRRRAVGATVFLFYLALSTGLCLYFPSDLVAIEENAERTMIRPPPFNAGVLPSEPGR